jgi:S-methylmethionine-dependent homocysteine/selenocysteine methylase
MGRIRYPEFALHPRAPVKISLMVAGTGLPMWSANALTTDTGLNVLRQIHLDYLHAGADILTANTFRTHRRALAGKGHAARELTRRAVATAPGRRQVE